MQYAPPVSTTQSQVLDKFEDEFPPLAPYDLDAEQAFLGCLLAWNEVLEEVPQLQGLHFWDPLHGFIFDTAAQVIRSGRKAAFITLKEALEKAPPVDGSTSALQYLGKLAANQHVSQASAKSYGQKIVDLHIRRALIVAGEDLAQDSRAASVATSPLILIEEMEARLFKLVHESAGADDATIQFSDAAHKAVTVADAAFRGGMAGIPTGLNYLDKQLGGLHSSDLLILAGRPSMGKTALATNIAVNVAESGIPVDFYSLEMSGDQLAMRVLAEKAGISASRYRRGDVKEPEMKALVMAAKDMSSLPLYIDQTGGISITQLTARARRNKRKRRTGLIIIDYLQLMQAGQQRRNSNRVQDITEITTGLKALAKELDVPVLALSQLNRSVEQRDDKRPQLSDLRESGSIEQDADVVMFCFREEYYLEREQPSQDDKAAHDVWKTKLRQCTGKAEVIIGKQRHGPIGIVPLAFNGALTKFSDLTEEAR